LNTIALVEAVPTTMQQQKQHHCRCSIRAVSTGKLFLEVGSSSSSSHGRSVELFFALKNPG
jgi:hypothetical protein